MNKNVLLKFYYKKLLEVSIFEKKYNKKLKFILIKIYKYHKKFLKLQILNKNIKFNCI